MHFKNPIPAPPTSHSLLIKLPRLKHKSTRAFQLEIRIQRRKAIELRDNWFISRSLLIHHNRHDYIICVPLSICLSVCQLQLVWWKSWPILGTRCDHSFHFPHPASWLSDSKSEHSPTIRLHWVDSVVDVIESKKCWALNLHFLVHFPSRSLLLLGDIWYLLGTPRRRR